MPRDEEIGKALNLLIHDLRAPLGVAHGYLRLITEHRLTSADEQDRALAQSLEALGRMARMCTDASAYLATYESEAPPATVVGTASDLAARVADALQLLGLAFTSHDLSASPRVARTDALAAAIATILGSIRRPSSDMSALAASALADRGHLHFFAGTDAQRAALMQGSRAPVDPWRGGHGLMLPLACLQVDRLGGHVWTTETARPGIAITLPLEGSSS